MLDEGMAACLYTSAQPRIPAGTRARSSLGLAHHVGWFQSYVGKDDDKEPICNGKRPREDTR
jgi:hypothetical protein